MTHKDQTVQTQNFASLGKTLWDIADISKQTRDFLYDRAQHIARLFGHRQ